MISIGITGSVGSGKTALLNYLIGRGYPAFSCDRCVHDLYSDPYVIKLVLNAIPELKKFDKIRLAQVIYADAKIRKTLEELVHPMVAELLEEFLQQNKSSPIVFAEIPLLFEAGWEKYCDYIIALHCDPKIRLERFTRRGMDHKFFALIESSQLPESMKIANADFAIDTSSSWDGVVENIERVIAKYPRL